MIWAAGTLQVALVTPRLFRGKSLSKRHEKAPKPMGRDAEVAFGEQHAPKWEARKIFGLEGHAASNTKPKGSFRKFPLYPGDWDPKEFPLHHPKGNNAGPLSSKREQSTPNLF